ncbi:ArdC family protein [Asticcacaulis sp.]|uniref:ArdC family protein n=1 Tax=Asticcacaulis sp. TaxID=1872648 RepID=UPI00391B1180
MPSSQSYATDVYAQITHHIVQAIEAGADSENFCLPWHRSGSPVLMPQNIASGLAYRGINLLALWAAADRRGYTKGQWGTYRQWQKQNAQVRKGEKATPIVFFKSISRDAGDDGGETEVSRGRSAFVARSAFVFNEAQVDGLSETDQPQTPQTLARREELDRFVEATGARIHIGGEDAFFSPAADFIALPDPDRFFATDTQTASQAWYATLLHELTHWSGHQTRLARQFGRQFGDHAYAMEELVAELGAAFLCADFGLSTSPRSDHACYIGQWLSVLKSDNRAIFSASGAAQRAVMFLKDLSNPA